MKKLIFLLLFLPKIIFSQAYIIDTFSYIGWPGDVREMAINTAPGAKYEFLFCTINVPDSLVIEMCETRIVFYPGERYLNSQIQGFLEFQYIPGIGVAEIRRLERTPTYLSSYHHACTDDSGVILVTVTVPESCCHIKWTVKGNLEIMTIYAIRVRELETGTIPSIDTTYTQICSKPYINYTYHDCERTLNIFSDSSIQTSVKIIDPNCINPGSITFSKYPEYNLYNLDTGYYYISISNSICEKYWNIHLENTDPCEIYIPNVFSPNDDGDNDIFSAFSDKSLPYNLKIFSRWGELLHSETHIANDITSGWDGMFRGQYCQDGVYVYLITFLDSNKQFSGDVTILK